MRFLQPFFVRTKLIWWDSTSFYFEQRIQSIPDGFIRAIAYSRQTIVNADAEQVLRKYLQSQNGQKLEIMKPEPREDFKHWLEFNKLNSKFLEEERGLEH